MTAPIRTLGQALKRGEPPPFEWIVEWASDGTLAAAWNAQDEYPADMIRLLERIGDHAAAVRALAAATTTIAGPARAVAQLVLDGDTDAAVRRLSSWATLPGGGTTDAYFAAFWTVAAAAGTATLADALWDWQTTTSTFPLESRACRAIVANVPAPSLEAVLASLTR